MTDLKTAMQSITGAELKAAKESHAYWSSTGLVRVGVIGMLAMEEGESSFNAKARGDKVHGVPTAFGVYQDHLDRVEEIKKGCHIDVRTASHLDQLKGAHYEITAGWYKHVWAMLMAAKSLREAVTILVVHFEQSGEQARDIERRLVFAEEWGRVFPA